MTNAHEFLEWFQNATDNLDDDVIRDVVDAELFDVADVAIDARGVVQTAIDRAYGNFGEGDNLDEDDMRRFIQDVASEAADVGASTYEVASAQIHSGNIEDAKKGLDFYAQAEVDADELDRYMEPFSHPIDALTDGIADYAEAVALKYFSTYLSRLEALADDTP